MFKYFSFIFSIILIIVGMYLALKGYLSEQRNWFYALVPIIAGCSFLLKALNSRYENIKRQYIYSERTFEAYVANNPSSFVNSQITCNKCGSAAIKNETVWGASYKQVFAPTKAKIYQQHRCKKCNAILFFSLNNAE